MIHSSTQGLPHRGKWVSAGIVLGTLGACGIAFFTSQISNALHGMGNEVLQASILLIAAAMIGWTVLWITKHAASMRSKWQQLGSDARAGRISLWIIMSIIACAVLREGAEIVLFLFGILSSPSVHYTHVIIGSIIGLLGGVVFGACLYLGMVKLRAKRIFQISSWLLMILAAGMAGQAANFLAAAEWLPEITPQLWDSSWLLSEHSLSGEFLAALLGYTDHPSGIQGLFFLATLAVLLPSYLRLSKR
jgi:high-affinity iron transporter